MTCFGACKKHKENPERIYSGCVGCDLEWLRLEVKKLRDAIKNAGFAICQFSGDWTLHDVSKCGEALEAKCLEVATRNVDLELENARMLSAFEPVRHWYDGDGERTDVVAMLKDAVEDLQHDRKDCLRLRRALLCPQCSGLGYTVMRGAWGMEYRTDCDLCEAVAIHAEAAKNEEDLRAALSTAGARREESLQADCSEDVAAAGTVLPVY